MMVGDKTPWIGPSWIYSTCRPPMQLRQCTALWACIENRDLRFYFDYRDYDMYLINSQDDIWTGSKDLYWYGV